MIRWRNEGMNGTLLAYCTLLWAQTREKYDEILELPNQGVNIMNNARKCDENK